MARINYVAGMTLSKVDASGQTNYYVLPEKWFAKAPSPNGCYISANFQVLDMNKTNLTTTIRVYLDWKSSKASGSGSAVRGYINGTQLENTYTSISSGQSRYMGHLDITIPHNQTTGQGVQNITYSVVSNWNGLGSCENTVTVYTNTYPRASTPTATSGNIEDNIVININAPSPQFTHNLYYSFGALQNILISSNVQNSYSWTLPIDLYEQIPNAQYGTGTIICNTYNGSTYIGQKTCPFTAYANQAKCTPEISMTVEDVNEKSVALTGDSSKLIKFVSNAKVTLTSSAKNSATISTNTITCSNTSVNATEYTFEKIESNSFKGTTTDSRKYSNTVERTVDIVPYIKLTLNPELYRPEKTGSQINAKLDGNFFNGNFGKKDNTLSLKFRFKKKTDPNFSEEYTTLTPVINENNTYSLDVSLGENFNYKEAYDFEFVVADKIDTFPIFGSISKAIPIRGTFEHFEEHWGIKSFEESEDGTKLIINKNIVVGDTKKDFETIINNMITIDNDKNAYLEGNLYLPRMLRIFSENAKILTHNSDNHATVLAADGGNVIFRANGADIDTGQAYLATNGNFVATGNMVSNHFYNTAGTAQATMSGNVSVFTIQQGSKIYLEVQTQHVIGGYTAFGIDVWGSDKRLKKSIKDTKVNALDIIMQIKHREFKYKNNDQFVKIGYVADELQEIDEQLIFEVGEDKLKQPSTSYIIPILTKAMQEQQEYIKKLEKRIEILEKVGVV